MGILRFLLAIVVLIVHSSAVLGYKNVIPGHMAVQSFYIISGYLMVMVYHEKYSLMNKSYFLFITNRFYRIFPLYWLVVLFVILFSLATGLKSGYYGKLQNFYTYYNSGFSLGALFVVGLSNISLFGQDVLTFFSINKEGFYFHGFYTYSIMQELLAVPIGWTIALELMFYLTTPFLTKKNNVLILLGLVVLLRIILYFVFNVNQGIILYKFMPTEYFWYLLGALSFHLYKNKLLPNEKWKWLFLVSILCFVLIIPQYGLINYVCLYGLIVVGMGSLLHGFAKLKIDKELGELSYPIYLFHIPVLGIVTANFFPKFATAGEFCLVLTLLISFFVNRFFVQKIEIFRAKRISKKI